eukprot:6947188-Alexandrium_andersonii.AAC.1
MTSSSSENPPRAAAGPAPARTSGSFRARSSWSPTTPRTSSTGTSLPSLAGSAWRTAPGSRTTTPS